MKHITVLDILGLIFIALKLCGAIGWNWWWVLTPFWIQLLMVVACILIIWLDNRRF